MKAAAKLVPITPIALEPGRVARVPVDMLVADPDQPRKEFDAAALDELAADIKQRGIENPILVRTDYVIKHGERRWRAAKLAGLKEVPCLLAGAADAEAPALARAFDQVKDNHLHRPLTVMEWAAFFRRLVDHFGVKVGEIPEHLEARGIRSMSRSYVSNILRLLDLPDWAQALINQGKLTPAHGKHILLAKPSPKALDALRKDIERDLADDEPITVDDVTDAVVEAFGEKHIRLNRTYGDDAPQFNVATCKDCPNRHEIKGRFGGHVFCLDAKCFGEKQAAARAKRERVEKVEKGGRAEAAKPKQPTGPTKVKERPDGSVDVTRLESDKYHFLDAGGVRFEPAMSCTDCPHNKPAVYGRHNAPRPCCFNPPCFAEHQRNGSKHRGIAEWLDAIVLPEILAKLPGNHDLQFQLLAWMALGAPTSTGDEWAVERDLEIEQRETREQLKLINPAGVIAAYTAGALNVEAIAAAGVRALARDRASCYAFARHLGVRLTPAIAAMDADYLALKRKPELLAIAKRSGLVADTADLAKQKLEEIKAFCLTAPVVAAIGVPEEVQRLYDTIEPDLPEDDEEEEEEDDDDDDDNEPDPEDDEPDAAVSEETEEDEEEGA